MGGLRLSRSLAMGSAIVGVALLVVATAMAATWRTFGKETARGDFAVAVASGDVKKPKRLRVVVQSRPRQQISGSYSVICTKGFGAGSKSGNFSGQTPLKKRMKKPYRRPDDCTASASAQLEESGRLKVKLQAKR